MIVASRSHLVVIPSYNTGAKVLETARAARQFWEPVWIVVDGSTDGTADALDAMAKSDPGMKVFVLPSNQGKGAAVLHGICTAEAAGFTHVLTMDADGQHPPDKIPEFMAASAARPDAMILGLPVFDSSVPLVRLKGRKISNALARFETLWGGIGDVLFGFRVYPIAPLREIMERRRSMRRFDFDPEAAVRLYWRGVDPINVPAPVKYLRPEEGGVSHFNYVRDNVLLTWMNLRLVAGMVLRLPMLLGRKRRKPGKV
ncbi:MAG TPA: glycosyltransferase family 2 protein [Burkholderiales bacterium]|nr:glycosyltransferase family 2 protein [Burkholderiales bacterium]